MFTEGFTDGPIAAGITITQARITIAQGFITGEHIAFIEGFTDGRIGVHTDAITDQK